jgi:hypothetical protein
VLPGDAEHDELVQLKLLKLLQLELVILVVELHIIEHVVVLDVVDE